MKKHLTEIFITSVLLVPYFAALFTATAYLRESTCVASVIVGIGLGVTCSLFFAWGYVEGKETQS